MPVAELLLVVAEIDQTILSWDDDVLAVSEGEPVRLGLDVGLLPIGCIQISAILLVWGTMYA